MARVIECIGNRASRPYSLTGTNKRLYTIEELCYYVGRNVDLIEVSFFSESLISFIENELGLTELAVTLSRLSYEGASAKELIKALLGGCNLYSEAQVRVVLAEIDEIAELGRMGRLKRRADKALDKGELNKAFTLYRSIMYSKDSMDLSDADYGNMLHNMSVISMRFGMYDAAAEGFKEAYERNGNIESLKEYILALKIGGREDDYNKELTIHAGERLFFDDIVTTVFDVENEPEKIPGFREIERLKQLYSQERMTEFETLFGGVIDELKKNYRREGLS